jgi:pre-mRNA-splicing factor ATP-dependent RNA helicase DHX15/PRP43
MTAAQAQKIEDGSQNPLTRKAFTHSFKELVKKRRELPVYKQRDDFLTIMHSDCKVLVLSGGTGTGKSTQLPALLLLDLASYLKESKRMIAVTEPRRLAARSLAQRVAADLDVKVGQEVAFKYRDSTADGEGTSTAATLLQFCTDGSLLASAINDPSLKKYRVIFIDEAHERTPDTDLLIAAIRMAQKNHSDLQLVIISATISVQGFLDYFPGAACLEIAGRNFEVTKFFARDRVDPIKLAADTAVKLHLEEFEGGILVFVSSKSEIKKTMGLIRGCLGPLRNSSLCGEYELVELHGKLPQDKQDLAMRLAPLSPNTEAPGRKIIVSTNVAEASVTVNGLMYVVDTCDAWSKIYDPRSTAFRMYKRPASKQEMEQRAGQAGRQAPGMAYRCITAAQYLSHPDTAVPAMLIQSPTETMLKVLSLLEGRPRVEVLEFDLLAPPAAEAIIQSFGELVYLNFVDRKGVLTDTGKAASKVSVGPRYARMIMRSAEFGCSDDMCSIVAMAEVLADRELYILPWGPTDEDFEEQEKKLRKSKRDWFNERGELVEYLAIYDAWSYAAHPDAPDFDALRQDFCDRFMFNKRTLQAVDTSRARIVKSFRLNGLQMRSLPFAHRTYYDTIVRALCMANFMNAVVRSPQHDMKTCAAYLTLRDQRIVYWDKDDRLDRPLEEYVMFDSLLLKGALPMMQLVVTPVKMSWLITASVTYFCPEDFPPGKPRRDMINIIHAFTGLDKDIIAGQTIKKIHARLQGPSPAE